MHGYAADGFVVADNDPSCEPFSFADIDDPNLDEEARQFISPTIHRGKVKSSRRESLCDVLLKKTPI